MKHQLHLAGAAAMLLVMGLAQPLAAQEVEQFFKSTCAACHTIGNGPLVGPDLKGVTGRRDRAWLVRFIPAPIKVIESGDPYVLQLQKDSHGLVMPSLPTLTPALVNSLIDYIESQSGTAPAQGAAPPPAPFTPAQVVAGTGIFSGRQRLASGGPACISCHTVRGVGGLGGGQLAPDLTRVYERLGGRRGLTTWLGAPATPTMQSVFAKAAIAPAEIDDLVAYFEQASEQGGQDNRAGLTSFALLGIGFAAVGLIVMDSAWKNRLRSVRRALVERTKRS